MVIKSDQLGTVSPCLIFGRPHQRAERPLVCSGSAMARYWLPLVLVVLGLASGYGARIRNLASDDDARFVETQCKCRVSTSGIMFA